MITKAKTKDTAYLIISNVRAEQVWILSENSGMYTVKLSSTGGAICVKPSRLFATQEEAEALLKRRKGDVIDIPGKVETPAPQPEEVFHSPHYYGW